MLKENLKIKEDDLDVLQLIHKDPKISQRKIASKLGLSLGKVNYCIKSLSKIGFIKLKNFSDSDNKKLYMYLLFYVNHSLNIFQMVSYYQLQEHLFLFHLFH